MSKINDFNDYHREHGIEALANLLEPTLIKDNEEIPCDTFIDKEPESRKSEESRLLGLFPWNAENPCRDFTLEYFPERLRRYIENLCKCSEAHPIIITNAVISTISAFIGSKFKYKYGANIQYYCNLWSVVIAPSGCLKSTGLNLGSRLGKIRQKKVFENIKQAENDNSMFEDTREKYIASCQSRDVFLPSKGSIAGLIEHLREADGVVHSDEFGAFIKNLGKQYNIDGIETLTQLFDTSQAYYGRTKTDGRIEIERPFISIFGITTNRWLEEEIQERDIGGGFWPRFLLFAPHIKIKQLPSFPPDIEINKALEDGIYEALSKITGEKEYSYSPEAIQLIDEINTYIYTYKEKYKKNDVLDAYYPRWLAYVFKISIIMQFFIDSTAIEISYEAVIAAFSYVKPAIDSTIMLCDGIFAPISKTQKKIEQVYRYIKHKQKENNNQGIERYTIIRSKILNNTKEYDEALQTLIESERIDFTIKNPRNKSLYCIKKT